MSDTDTTETEVPIEQQLAADLRKLADWIETRPVVAKQLCFEMSRLTGYPNQDEWADTLRDMGTFEKKASDNWLDATAPIGDLVVVRMTIQKSQTCERVQVGEREEQRSVYPDDVVPAIETVKVPVYEYRCPPSWIASES